MKYEPIISDSFYHIYNQGNNGENIFKEEKNYTYFLQLTKKHMLPVAKVYAYCLLKNHFHFLIKTKNIENEKRIAKGFSNLFNAYAKAINKRYNRTGSLFKDRFSRIKVTNEKYLKALIVYIHLNPKHHNFTNDFKNYPHSSYKIFTSSQTTKLERSEALELFDDRDNFIYYHNYRQNLIDRIDSIITLE